MSEGRARAGVCGHEPDGYDGLVLAEQEASEALGHDVPPVPGLVAEVKADDRFTGGTLARTDAARLRYLLASFGLAPSR